MSATESVKQMGNSFNGVPLRFGYDRNGKAHIEMLDYNGNAGILISGKRGITGKRACKALLNEMMDSLSIVPVASQQIVFINFPSFFQNDLVTFDEITTEMLMQETENRIKIFRTSTTSIQERKQSFRKRLVVFLWLDHRISRKMREWINVVTRWGIAIKIHLIVFSPKRFSNWYQKELFACFNTYLELQETHNESAYEWKMQKVFWVDSKKILMIQGTEKT